MQHFGNRVTLSTGQILEPAPTSAPALPSPTSVARAPASASPTYVARAPQQVPTNGRKFDDVEVRLACGFKMISFSGTPEYNKAVDACVAKELPAYSASRNAIQNQQQENLRKEYNFQ
jgi:hypothetical protein